MAHVEDTRPALLRNFLQRRTSSGSPPGGSSDMASETVFFPMDTSGSRSAQVYDPAFEVVDRVIACKSGHAADGSRCEFQRGGCCCVRLCVIVVHWLTVVPRSTTLYLVKWKHLGYAACTWEVAEALQSNEDAAHVARFRAFDKMPTSVKTRKADPAAMPAFNNGRELRDYQVESLRWMVHCWGKRQNALLADEVRDYVLVGGVKRPSTICVVQSESLMNI